MGLGMGRWHGTAIFQNPDPNCARVAPELRSNYRAITGVNDVRCWAAILVAEQLWGLQDENLQHGPNQEALASGLRCAYVSKP